MQIVKLMPFRRNRLYVLESLNLSVNFSPIAEKKLLNSPKILCWSVTLLPLRSRAVALAEDFIELDGSFPANPVNDRRVVNAVMLKSTFCLP